MIRNKHKKMYGNINEFTVNSKQLADFLTKNGSKFLRVDDGVFIFEKDDSIDMNLDKWSANYKLCMF